MDIMRGITVRINNLLEKIKTLNPELLNEDLKRKSKFALFLEAMFK
jgi:hypothetical protein